MLKTRSCGDTLKFNSEVKVVRDWTYMGRFVICIDELHHFPGSLPHKKVRTLLCHREAFVQMRVARLGPMQHDPDRDEARTRRARWPELNITHHRHGSVPPDAGRKSVLALNDRDDEI